jgi:hypothetical protein
MKKKVEHNNSLSIGEINLSSTDLGMDDLINRMIFLLEHQTIKEYLSFVEQKKVLGGGSNYCG